MSDARVRFAPSPTGTLHIGSARTALYNYLFARHLGGTMVLRVEDTDLKRSRHEHELSIVRDLHWLGLQADEGPDVGGPYGPYRQSERGELYEAGIQKLLASGATYRCFCSQERLDELKAAQLAAGKMPKYDRSCLTLSADEVETRLDAGEEATVRFRVPKGDITFDDLIHGPITFSSDVIGDFIVRRTDGGFAYNYAVVIDDAGMRITHVVRGEDHITNTARQLMLYQALGEQAPVYAHHSLIHGADGGKLSKRHGATSIGEFRDMGYLSASVVNYLALLSWSSGDEREKFTLDELVAEFDMKRVSKSPAIFDLDKLNWLNGLYIRELSPEQLAEAVRPYLREAELEFEEGQRDVVAGAIQSNLVVLGDAPTYAEIFADEPILTASSFLEALHEPGADAVLAMLAHELESRDREYFSPDQARTILKVVADECKERGIKGKSIYKPLRVALTARDQGPELFYLVAGLGRSRIMARLRTAMSYVAQRGSE
ncbi:MAG TPA: glutamate--tRNA ligase [Thermoleophilia bacterium]|nr:glutamate--tRNA ligase [Thermoleophilia bacterium]